MKTLSLIILASCFLSACTHQDSPSTDMTGTNPLSQHVTGTMQGEALSHTGGSGTIVDSSTGATPYMQISE